MLYLIILTLRVHNFVVVDYDTKQFNSAFSYYGYTKANLPIATADDG